MGEEYRLRFESIDAHQAEAMEVRHGRGVWSRLTPEQWEQLEWQAPVEKVVASREEIADQHGRLKEWAESHDQPIRNVSLEVRERPESDVGWELADA